ncbi:hypothetical protein ACRAWD_06465 [Caulobacter segnis]
MRRRRPAGRASGHHRMVGDLLSEQGAGLSAAASIGGEAWDELAFVDDGDDPARDLACIEAAQSQLAQPVTGYIFLPFSFSSLVKPSVRETYRAAVGRFPLALRPRMAASVYDVPREPSYAAIGQIRSFLTPKFSLLDLHVRDPGFRIDSLPAGAAHSVTLGARGLGRADASGGDHTLPPGRADLPRQARLAGRGDGQQPAGARPLSPAQGAVHQRADGRALDRGSGGRRRLSSGELCPIPLRRL